MPDVRPLTASPSMFIKTSVSAVGTGLTLEVTHEFCSSPLPSGSSVLQLFELPPHDLNTRSTIKTGHGPDDCTIELYWQSVPYSATSVGLLAVQETYVLFIGAGRATRRPTASARTVCMRMRCLQQPNVWHQRRAQRVRCMPGLGWPLPFGVGCGWAQRPMNVRTEAPGVVRRSSEPPRSVPEPLGADAGHCGLFGVCGLELRRGYQERRGVLECRRSEAAWARDETKRAGEFRTATSHELPGGRGAETGRMARPIGRREGRRRMEIVVPRSHRLAGAEQQPVSDP